MAEKFACPYTVHYRRGDGAWQFQECCSADEARRFVREEEFAADGWEDWRVERSFELDREAFMALEERLSPDLDLAVLVR